jgi:hypothetical protein
MRILFTLKFHSPFCHDRATKWHREEGRVLRESMSFRCLNLWAVIYLAALFASINMVILYESSLVDVVRMKGEGGMSTQAHLRSKSSRHRVLLSK